MAGYTTSGQQLSPDQGGRGGGAGDKCSATPSGCHDAICGTSTLLHTTRHATGAAAPKEVPPPGRELFVLAAAKHGLEPRDNPTLALFLQGVRVEAATGPPPLAGWMRGSVGH